MPNKINDILVVGSGLSGLTFAEEYLKKNKKINLISPDFKSKTKLNYKPKLDYKALPPQFKKNFNKIEDYFDYNKIEFNKKNCNLLGSLEFGGLSNYWGLQIDKDIKNDLNFLTKNTKKNILKCFKEIIQEKSLLGEFKNYKNDFKINDFYENKINEKNKSKNQLFFEKSILAMKEKKNKNINKLVPKLVYEKIKKKIIFHNFFVDSIEKKKNLIYIHCINEKKKKKVLITKKIVLASGTLATTRLIMDYLKINKEVAIKHHPRLISVYLARKKIISNFDFTPGLFQIKSNNKKEIFSADIRPANETILNMALKIYNILNPLKFILLLFKNHIFFSNNLLGSKFSDLYIKKEKKIFFIYSKQKKKTLIKLKKKQRQIFDFLRKKKIIYPIFKNFFPGIGADYHYFGSIQMNKNEKLSVNENCQLKNNKSIYIADGSVFNFKKNLYPYAVVMANTKRIAKKLS